MAIRKPRTPRLLRPSRRKAQGWCICYYTLDADGNQWDYQHCEPIFDAVLADLKVAELKAQGFEVEVWPAWK